MTVNNDESQSASTLKLFSRKTLSAFSCPRQMALLSPFENSGWRLCTIPRLAGSMLKAGVSPVKLCSSCHHQAFTSFAGLWAAPSHGW